MFVDNTTNSILGCWSLSYQRGHKQMVSMTPIGIRGMDLF